MCPSQHLFIYWPIDLTIMYSSSIELAELERGLILRGLYSLLFRVGGSTPPASPMSLPLTNTSVDAFLDDPAHYITVALVCVQKPLEGNQVRLVHTLNTVN